MDEKVEWLRRRFSASRPRPAIRDPHASSGTPIAAAVLVPIVVRPSGLTVLLTQRTAHLRDHAGQVSFPGGRCEPGDASPVATALRESDEEVGIESAQVEVLGSLPDYFTGTGFRVTPVVGVVTPPLNLRLDDFEVAEVFEAPLEFLLDAANFRQVQIIGDRPQFYDSQNRGLSPIICWAVPWQEYFIWGATAGMLVSLRECLLAEAGAASVISSP